ncbi:hypothetical protein ASF69_10350 [Rhizobium sp. Leaf311]|nr:hypothetical protein ASF69_10350 [Rhizobium sp. Leaf311]
MELLRWIAVLLVKKLRIPKQDSLRYSRSDHTAGKAKNTAASCGLYIDLTVNGTQTGLATDLRMGMMNYLDLVQDFNTDNQDARKMIDAARAKNTSNAAPAPKL